MGYNIKLGAVGALKEYTLKSQGDDGIAWSRGPANPFAGKVNTANRYDEIDMWNEFVQEDWQQGVGRVDPEGGGFLYAECETRVPNQIILPALVRQVDRRTITGVDDDCRYMPQDMTSEVRIGSGGYTQVALRFHTPSSDMDGDCWLYMAKGSSTNNRVTIEVWTDSSGPGALVSGTQRTLTLKTDIPGFNWQGGANLIWTASLFTNTVYWLVIRPEEAGEHFFIGAGSSGYEVAARGHNGTSWSTISNTFLMYTTTMHRLLVSGSTNRNGLFRFNNLLHAYVGRRVYSYNSANDSWDLVGTGATDLSSISSAVTWGSLVYLGNDATVTDDYYTLNTSGTFTDSNIDGYLFTKYGPYLYRAFQNDLYYSANGSSWSGPFAIGGDDFTITGMAGMGDSLYVATEEALYRFAPGNVVEGVTTWGSIDNANGVSLINFQGALYCLRGSRIVSFTQDGRLMDVWVSRDNDLVNSRIGTVWKIAPMNNWIVALVSPSGVTGMPTVWAYQDGSWHHIATLPTNFFTQSSVRYAYDLYYDRASNSLWVITPDWITYRIYMPDYALNPYNDSAAYFMPRGWFEQDRYYGGLMLVDKDFESVTIHADSLSSNINVKVYWQDEGSTAWETLGTVTSDGQELRWSDHTTRPQGKWIKLGLLLQTNDGDETPRIRAVVVKNLPMANDRIRDTVTFSLGKIQGPDGKRDTLTLAQQLANVQSDIASVIPRIYEDPLGVQREVKVVDYSMTLTQFAHENSANVVKEMDVTLVLEQAPEGTYSA